MSFLFTIEQMDRMDAELNTTDHSLNTSLNKNIVSNIMRTTTNTQINTNCHSLQSNLSNSNNENLNNNSTLCSPLNKTSLQSLQTQNSINPIDKSNPLPSLSQAFKSY
jgi:hypothetical protein